MPTHDETGVSKRDGGARHKVNWPLIQPEERLRKAVKILGEHRRADVEAALWGLPGFPRVLGLIGQQAMWKRVRSQGAKQQKRFAKQYSAALRNVITLTEKARDLRIPPSRKFIEQLKSRVAICDIWEKSKSIPRPHADDKRLAACMALRLLKKEGQSPTTTKTRTFCRLAAVLYGDEAADLHHHCRVVLRRKVNMRSVKQSPARRADPTVTEHGDRGAGLEHQVSALCPDEGKPGSSADVEPLNEAQNQS